jgi:AcrR family transcriptional regulator
MVALKLFLEKGIDETTVAEIAAAADIGKGTFFTYFPTKESVFADFNLLLVEDMERGLDAAIAARARIEARTLAFFRPAIDWHVSNPVLSRYTFAAFMRDAAYMQAERFSQRRIYERLTRELSAAQADGAITDDVDVAAAVTAIAGTYFGSLSAWHGAETQTSLDADFTRALRIVFRGLRP